MATFCGLINNGQMAERLRRQLKVQQTCWFLIERGFDSHSVQTFFCFAMLNCLVFTARDSRRRTRKEDEPRSLKANSEVAAPSRLSSAPALFSINSQPTSFLQNVPLHVPPSPLPPLPLPIHLRPSQHVVRPREASRHLRSPQGVPPRPEGPVRAHRKRRRHQEGQESCHGCVARFCSRGSRGRAGAWMTEVVGRAVPLLACGCRRALVAAVGWNVLSSEAG